MGRSRNTQFIHLSTTAGGPAIIFCIPALAGQATGGGANSRDWESAPLAPLLTLSTGGPCDE